MSTLTQVSALVPGDLITEVDTPAGPYYRVLAATAAVLIVDASLPGDPELPTTLPVVGNGVVLRAGQANSTATL